MQGISLQKLFALACILKVGSSGIGWYTNSPWLFGLWIPLGIMILYMLLGHYKRDKSVSEEKFADSCYYLGFIFTIASIIFSLFDLKNIGTGLGDIGIRFGAAMISTCLGVAVRVALVTFRTSTDDALRAVEDALIETSLRLTDEFTRSFEQLVDFRGEVLTASREATNSVQLQIDSMAEQYKEQTKSYFQKITKDNSEMLSSLFKDISTTAGGLSSIMIKYETMAQSTTGDLDKTVCNFVSAIDNRLRSIAFPDDIFSKGLETPIATLHDSTNNVAVSTLQLAQDVKDSARSVASAVTRINTRAETLNETLDTLKQVAGEQQELVLSMERQQQSVLDQMTAYHTSFIEAAARQQEQVFAELKTHSTAVKSLNDGLDKIAGELAEGRKSSNIYLSGVVKHSEQLGDTLRESFDRFAEQAAERIGESTNVEKTFLSMSAKLDILVEVAQEQLKNSSSSMQRLDTIQESLMVLNKRAPEIGRSNISNHDPVDLLYLTENKIADAKL